MLLIRKIRIIHGGFFNSLYSVNSLIKRVSSSSFSIFGLYCQQISEDTSKTLEQYKIDKLSNKLVNRIYRIKINEDDSKNSINAYVLPAIIDSWPTFKTLKQTGKSCANICLVRTQNPTQSLYVRTLESLKSGANVAWIGAAGIGKSSSYNFVLIELLRNIGEDGWPSKVLLRIPHMLYIYSIEKGKREIFIESFKAREMFDVENIIEKNRDNAVCIMEMNEYENDPQIDGIPTLFALSSQHADKVLKSIDKQGNINWLLFQPYSIKEVEESTLLMHGISDEKLPFVDDTVYNNNSEKSTSVDILRKVKIRFAEIGGLPRLLFGNDTAYHKYLSSANVALPHVIQALDEMTVFNIPENAKYFIAPFLKEFVENPLIGCLYKDSVPSDMNANIITNPNSDNYTFDFLTREMGFKLLQQIQPGDNLGPLNRSFINTSIRAELLVHFNCILDSENRNEEIFWKPYNDVGFKTILRYDNKSDFRLSKHPKKSIHSSGSLIDVDVRKLSEDYLYRSITHNGNRADFISVDHSAKRLYIHQIILLDFLKHPFSLTTMKSVLNGLRINHINGPNSDYSIILLSYCDWSLEKQHGIKFVLKDKSPGFTLQEWREDWAVDRKDSIIFSDNTFIDINPNIVESHIIRTQLRVDSKEEFSLL